MKRHHLFTYLIDPSQAKLYFSDVYYCYSYFININCKLNAPESFLLRKKLLQKWLDNVYSCTPDVSPNKYRLPIHDLLSFALDLFRSLNNLYFLFLND